MAKPTPEQIARFEDLMNREILTDIINDALEAAGIEGCDVSWKFTITPSTSRGALDAPILLADGTNADTVRVGTALRVKANTFKIHLIPIGATVILEKYLPADDMAYVTWHWSKHPAPLKQSVPWIDLEVL